jgi:pimeloyl-ACP methyl ester carboxylesterase
MEPLFEKTVVPTDDGTLLNVFTCGDVGRPAVLLINAYGIPVAIMEPLARVLSAGFRVISWESRGVPSGDGPFDPESCDLSTHVDDALCVLESQDLESAHIAGWCTGGQVALKLASLHPYASRDLVLMNGTFRLPDGVISQTAFFGNMRRIMPKIAVGMKEAKFWHNVFYGNASQQGYGGVVPEEGDGETNPVMETDPAILEITRLPFDTPEHLYRYANLIMRFYEEPEHAWASNLTNCTMVLSAEHDAIAHPNTSREIAARIDDSQLVVVPGGDHFGIYSSDDVMRTVYDFLAGNRPG